MQNLSEKINVRIIRIYGVAGRGKRLNDAMSSFGVKVILKMIPLYMIGGLKSSFEICEYLGLKARGCMYQHIFEYVPNSNAIFFR